MDYIKYNKSKVVDELCENIFTTIEECKGSIVKLRESIGLDNNGKITEHGLSSEWIASSFDDNFAININTFIKKLEGTCSFYEVYVRDVQDFIDSIEKIDKYYKSGRKG